MSCVGVREGSEPTHYELSHSLTNLLGHRQRELVLHHRLEKDLFVLCETPNDLKRGEGGGGRVFSQRDAFRERWGGVGWGGVGGLRCGFEGE